VQALFSQYGDYAALRQHWQKSSLKEGAGMGPGL
jgi:hypothetical protein